MGKKISSCVLYLFIGLNLLYWIIGIGLTAYVIWNIATLTNRGTFLAGTQIFNYFILSVGGIIFFIGLAGCIGAVKKSTCLLKTYLTVSIILLMLEGAAAIFLYAQQDQFLPVKQSLWTGLNQASKDHIQTNLQCCGYEGSAEYGADIPSSCYPNADASSNSTQFNITCSAKIDEWLNVNIPIWSAVLGCLGFIQIATMMASCNVITTIQARRRVTPDGQGTKMAASSRQRSNHAWTPPPKG